MSQEKKERVGILMPPSQVAEIDALYPLHGHASRSDFVCKAVEFYTGFLQQDSSEFYMSKTTLAFLEDQLGKLESRICRQLFRSRRWPVTCSPASAWANQRRRWRNCGRPVLKP